MINYNEENKSQSKKKNSKYKTGIDYNEQILVNQKRKFQSTKQVSIAMKKITQYKVQKRCVFLKLHKRSFPRVVVIN